MRTRSGTTIATLCVALLALPTACSNDRDDDRGATSGSAAGTVDADVRVSDVEVGRAIGSDKRISDETDDFRPSDTIYASVVTEGSAPSTTLTARWTFQDGQLVEESSQTIQPSGTTVTEFHIAKPDGFPAGKYRVQIMLGGREVGNEEFEVKR
jgi:hypothetical protein